MDIYNKIYYASNLEELRDALNEFEQILKTSDENQKHDMENWADRNLPNLPVFDENWTEDTVSVFSWDENRILVYSSGSNEWKVEER